MRAFLSRFGEPERLSAAATAGAVLALVAVRLVAAGFTELGADESYYWLWSRDQSWGYYDHPPMVAWWIAAGTALLGDGAFGVRFFFVLSAIPISLALYFAGRLLFDRPAALFAVLWINATLLVGVGGISATPDAPAVLFWIAATAGLAAVATTGKGWWWLAVGLFAGLGVVSKLTDLFLGPGILLAVIARPDLRRWLATPWPWLGGAVAVAVVAPMLWWNAGHDWMTFSSQFSRLGATSFAPQFLPEMIGVQFLLLNPVIGVFVGLAIIAWMRRLPPYPISPLALLFWTVVPLVAVMAVHALRTQVYGNWLAPIFPSLVLAAAAVANPAPERWAALRTLAFPLGVGLSLAGLVLAANPGGILPTHLDPARANRGWFEMAAEADQLRRQEGAAWIATTQYDLTATLTYSLRGTGTPVASVAQRHRYEYAPQPPAGLLAEPALLIASPETAALLAPCLGAMTDAGTLERREGGAVIDTFAAFLVAGIGSDAFSKGCDAAVSAAD